MSLDIKQLSHSELLRAIVDSEEVREGIASEVESVSSQSLALAREVACRVVRNEIDTRPLLDRPDLVNRYVLLRFSVLDQEVMGALFLDVRHRLIEAREIFRGTISRCSVEPRSILRTALELGAASFVLFHTHPSGDSSPSVEDQVFTERLQQAAETVGVRFVDHVICGNPQDFTSLRREGSLR